MRVMSTMLAGLLAAGALGLGACGTMGERGLVRSTPTCQDFTVSIYFERDSSALTRPARAIINSAASRVRGCQVNAVEVLGLADAVGDPQANLELSGRRTATVTQALEQRGLRGATFRTGAAGEAGAETRAGEIRPLRRRVDITLRVGNRPAA